LNDSEVSHVICRGCKSRYNLAGIAPGEPFSCRKCGEIVYAPGEKQKKFKKFGEIAVEKGFVTKEQLDTVLTMQKSDVFSKSRIGELMSKQKMLTSAQISGILQAQGSNLAKLIPGYEIVAKLGEGGMGAVYKGVHLASRKTVAMKILAPRLSKRPEFLERFHLEARVAINLDHPNIVKGFDEGLAENQHYFVMEYVHGKTAARVLRKRGAFSERRAMDIVRQVARALEYAHSRNIVHRDVKPDNIMINREGKAKLADYGLVKYLDDIDAAGLTSEGQIMGTPNYISPEQASGKDKIDIRSDIYSLGATLFHLLTGKPPFRGKTAAVIMGMHLSAPVPDPSEYMPELSDEACRIVEKMLAKKPSDRYQTPAELLAAIEKYFAAKSYSTRTKRGEMTSTTDFWDTKAELEEEEDLLESVGEDGRELSRTAILLFATGIFVLLVGVGLVILNFWSQGNNTANQAPLEVGTDVGKANMANGLADMDVSESRVSAHDNAAAALYKKAVMLEGEARVEVLRDLVKRYPNSPLCQISRKEITAWDTSCAQEAKDLQETQRQALDRESEQNYHDIIHDNFDSPEAMLRELSALIKKYPGTKGAKEAEFRRERISVEVAEKKKREEANRKRQQEASERQENFEKKRAETIAKAKFLKLFQDEFNRFNLDDAGRFAEKLAQDERFPGLNELGKMCKADVDDLARVYPAVTAALRTLDRKDTVTLRVNPGGEVTGNVVAVSEGMINILLNGELLQKYTVNSLTPEMVEKYFRAGYKGDCPAELCLALFYHVTAKMSKNADQRAIWQVRAEDLFKELTDRDPRAQHHADMLQWE
jgi:serine/threonine-protein kinase